MSYVSAWNANEGLTATIVEEGDFVVSDALNHASIIDSIRLAKAITKCTTGVYKHGDLDDLRDKLEGARSARRRLIWTDGVFSMEGSIARLPELLQIARDHDAVLIVDDSHATGVLGKNGPRHRRAFRRCSVRSTSSHPRWVRPSAAQRADSWPARQPSPTI